MRNESEIQINKNHPEVAIHGVFGVDLDTPLSRREALKVIGFSLVSLSLAGCMPKQSTKRDQATPTEQPTTVTAAQPKIPTSESKRVESTTEKPSLTPNTPTPEPSPTLTTEQQKEFDFKVGLHNMRQDFALQFAGDAPQENAKVIPYLYGDNWPALNELFEDWSGTLSTGKLKKMFSGADGKLSYNQLPLLADWAANSRFLTETMAEPDPGRVVIFGHSGVERARGPLPFNYLKNSKIGDIEFVIQNGVEQKYIVTNIITVPVNEIGKYQGEISLLDATLSTDIYSLYLDNLNNQLDNGNITQNEYNTLFTALDQTFSTPGLDLITCEASDPSNPLNFDQRVIVTTVLLPNN